MDDVPPEEHYAAFHDPHELDSIGSSDSNPDALVSSVATDSLDTSMMDLSLSESKLSTPVHVPAIAMTPGSDLKLEHQAAIAELPREFTGISSIIDELQHEGLCGFIGCAGPRLLSDGGTFMHVWGTSLWPIITDIHTTNHTGSTCQGDPGK